MTDTFTGSDWDEELADFEGPSARFQAPEPVEVPPEEQRSDSGFVCDYPGCDYEAKPGPRAAASLKRHQTSSHGAGKDAPPPAPARGKTDRLHDQAEAFTLFFYEMAGGVWAQADPNCGNAWRSCRPAATEAWYEAAKKNGTVRRILESTENVGVVGQLFVAHMPIMVAVQQHHIAPRIAEARRIAEEQAHEPEPEPTTADFLDGQPGYNGTPG